MSDFVAERLTKTIGDKTVFQSISFIIHAYDRIGIIGVNGTGKTTLLDVISGELGFDGDVSPFSTKSAYSIAYLKQHPNFDLDKTVLDTVLSDDLEEMALLKAYESLLIDYTQDHQDHLERIMAKMDALKVWEIESQVKTVLNKLGLSHFHQKLSDLSGGLRRRVQLAQALLGKEDLLLLDEPTNHLDIETIEWLITYLKQEKRTVLFITHDRYFLDALSTRIFELDRGDLIEYQGNYQDYVRLKAERDEQAVGQRHKKEQLFKQEREWMRRQPQARATKQEARIHRFHQLEEDLKGQKTESKLDMSFQTSRIGKKVIQFEDVSFQFPNRSIINAFSLLIQNRDRIGIVGKNGMGKSTLLNLISGDLTPSSGQLEIGETVKIGYFSQQIKGLDPNKRVISFLQEVAEEAHLSSGQVSVVDLLEQFLFPRSSHGTFVSKLSGGEQKRLYLLKLLIQQPNVLLLDEPTNDLDIATLTVLETFLQTFEGPVITVSHDRYFLDKMANKILAFEADGIHTFYGNYTDYLDEKAFLKEKSVSTVQEKEQKGMGKPRRPKQQRMSYVEKQEWASIESAIDNLEAEITDIESTMEEKSSDFTALATLQETLEAKNQELLKKYERFDYLSQLE